MHWICLPVPGSAEHARDIAHDLAWIATERGWTPQRPLLALQDEAILSLTARTPLSPVQLIRPQDRSEFAPEQAHP